MPRSKLKKSGSPLEPAVLADRVYVELPVSLADIIGGLSDDLERLSGEAGLLIMQAVMKGEVDAIAGPKGKHDPHREATRWTRQRGYVVMAGKKVPVTVPILFGTRFAWTACRSWGRVGRGGIRRSNTGTYPTPTRPTPTVIRSRFSGKSLSSC